MDMKSEQAEASSVRGRRRKLYIIILSFFSYVDLILPYLKTENAIQKPLT
jgi:hypothetical protein